MWIIPLRSMVGTYGSVRRNRPVEIDDHIAERLIAKGRAVPMSPPVAVRGKTKKKPSPPGKTGQTGGRTGKGKRSPSSAADPAPAPQTSISSEGAPEQSQSTTPGS